MLHLLSIDGVVDGNKSDLVDQLKCHNWLNMISVVLGVCVHFDLKRYRYNLILDQTHL